MLPTKMHMRAGRPMALSMISQAVMWKRATLCGKYLRLELTTEDWAKVGCKMCLKVKASK